MFFCIPTGTLQPARDASISGIENNVKITDGYRFPNTAQNVSLIILTIIKPVGLLEN